MKFNCAINKRTLAYFSKYIALFGRVKMEHEFIQMTSTAGRTIPDSINSIFQHISECFCFKLTNSKFDFLFQVLNRFWVVIENFWKADIFSPNTIQTRVVRVKFILDSFSQKIVQRLHIKARLNFNWKINFSVKCLSSTQPIVSNQKRKGWRNAKAFIFRQYLH